jgi:hypothetical protein
MAVSTGYGQCYGHGWTSRTRSCDKASATQARPKEYKRSADPAPGSPGKLGQRLIGNGNRSLNAQLDEA